MPEPQVELVVVGALLSEPVPVVGCSVVVGLLSDEPPNPGINLRTAKKIPATITRVMSRREKVVRRAMCVSGEW